MRLFIINITLLLLGFNCVGQTLVDSITTKNNKLIICNITLINDQNIFYEYIIKKNRIEHTYISLDSVMSYVNVKPPPVQELTGDGELINEFRHTIFGEFAGNAFYSSANYSLTIKGKKDFSSSFRLGYIQGFKGDLFLIPAELSIMHGLTRRSHLEFGAGVVYYRQTYHYHAQAGGYFYDKVEGKVYSTVRIGYRYQPPKKGLFFTVGFTPLLGIDLDGYSHEIKPWGGVGIGYTLN